MTDVNSLLAEINALSGGADDTPLAWNQIAGATQSNAPLTPVEKTLGYARSYLGGPTFGYADNLEALLSTVLGGSYSNELTRIRDEQQRFKDKTDYIDNAVEIGSGAVLNPLSWLKAASVGSKAIPSIQQAFKAPILGTTLKAGTTAPAQAALASIGADNGEAPLEAGLKGAAVGTGFSALASVLGKGMTEVARNANRLKLSAFGIGQSDIASQVKKLTGMGAQIGKSADDIPLVKTLTRAEDQGIINAGDDIVTNANNVRTAQDGIATKLNDIIVEADKVGKPRVDFGLKNTIKYIEGLSGTAQDDAAKAADAEINALLPQLKQGKIADLQKAKIGLNYKWGDSPYKDDIIKALRSDLKEEIENRVTDLAKNGKIQTGLAGKVEKLNAEWGDLAELRKSFLRRVQKDLGGDAVEDAFGMIRTSGGAGSLNLASAVTGNPIFMGLGALMNAARVPESKSAIADVIRDPAIKGLLEKVGVALPEVVTGRNVAQGLSALENPPPKENDAAKLLAEIEMLSGAISGPGDAGSTKKNSSSFDLSSLNPLAATEVQAMEFNPGERKAMAESDIPKETLAAIKSDPVDYAIAMTESSMDPKAKNPNSSAGGLYQFLDETANALGLDDKFDADKNYKAYLRLKDEAKEITRGDPDLTYAAHYLGETLLRKVLNKQPLSERDQKIVDGFTKRIRPDKPSPLENFQENYKNYLKVISA